MMPFLKLTVRILLILGVIAGAIWLGAQSGSARFMLPASIAGKETMIETPLVVFVAVLVVLLLVSYWVLRLVGGLYRIPSGARLSRRAKKAEDGLAAIRASLMALASGDTVQAQKEAERCEKLLPHTPEIALLLKAQAADAAGDKAAAEIVYRRLQNTPATAFAGTRALLLQAHEVGDTSTAYALARQAYAQKPSTPGLARTLAGLHAARGAWEEALHLLPEIQSQKNSALSSGDYRLLKAKFLTEQSRDLLAKASPEQATRLAAEATECAPTFAAAWGQWATCLIQQQQPDKAAAIFLKGVKRSKEASLPLAALSLFSGYPIDWRLRLAIKTARISGEMPAALYALAVLEAESGQRHQAQTRLEKLVQGWPVDAAFRHLADINRDNHQAPDQAPYWQSKIATAMPLPNWHCTACNAVHHEWYYTCTACHKQDTVVFGSDEASKRVGVLVAG